MPLSGSIITEVPVKPVWLTDSGGKNGMSERAKTEDTSQPRPRLPLPSAVRVHMLRTVSALRMRVPSRAPPASIIRQMRARSVAVENMPACRATPPRRRAR